MVEHARILDVGGVTVDVRADGDDYAKCARARLGTDMARGPVELTVVIGPTAPVPPEPRPHQHMEGFDGWEADGVTWIGKNGAVARVAGTALEVGGPIDSRQTEDVLDDLLQFGLATAMARPDRLMIHGAVVARDGDALVLVGSSGRGKSTLAAAALVGGWELLGDDLAVFSTDSGQIQGVQRAPMVPAEIADLHGITGSLEFGPRRRVQLPVDVLQPAPRRLIGVVTIAHGDEGGMEPLPGADLTALDGALAVPPFRSVIRRQLAAAAALVALPTVLLSHASDLDVRIQRAQSSLDAVLAHCRDHATPKR